MSKQRLTDIDALLEKVTKLVADGGTSAETVGKIIIAITEAPNADGVEVVRCKDCTNYEEQCPAYGYCWHWKYETGESPNEVDPDDFCSYGERKDNG